MRCKYCDAEMPIARQRSGALSRSRVCAGCKYRSIERQKASALVTRQAKLPSVSACYNCLCPLLLLRKENGKQEQRRFCARCKEANEPVQTSAAQKKRDQVKAWQLANREKMQKYLIEWRKKHPDQSRPKLLIEDVRIVREAMRAYYDRSSQKTKVSND